MSASPSCFIVPVQPAALELLADLSKVLANWGRWYVFGAQAVIAYGVPRLSADVDVTVKLAPDDPERFSTDMQAAGFALRVDDPDFVRRTRVMPFVHVGTAMPVDVVLAASGLEDEFLDRAQVVDLGGTSVPLIGPEDLVIAKVLAGRPKDVEDARGLWRVRGQELDMERIRGTLRRARRGIGPDRSCFVLRVNLAKRNCPELRSPPAPLAGARRGPSLPCERPLNQARALRVSSCTPAISPTGAERTHH